MKNNVKKIILFASGNGSNVENIIKYFQNSLEVKVILVAGNNKNAQVFKRAKFHGIKTLIFDRIFFNSRLFKTIKEYEPDLIVLAGFLWKIPQSWISNFSNQILNIHPSLLPKYGGKGMFGINIHKAVKTNQEKETGITIHLVNEDYDKGKIIFQKKTKIPTNFKVEDIAIKVQELEKKYFPKVIEEYLFNEK
ncbi:MAG: phosphoribosylglycinamide formyltransferase [Flavobacteriales bacterium]|nr:phosphoribosylglycinamide formyltransferase [Flavobacteriales bacterium]